MANLCPRCGEKVMPGDTGHDYDCLEDQLVKLYQLGVKRGLQGEYDGNFDGQGSAMIEELISMVWGWREASKAVPQPATSLHMVVQPTLPARDDQDLDTQVARFMAWQNIGWLNGQAVSGRAAWYDPQVRRRSFSTRPEDAGLVHKHPALRGFELLHIHRLYTNQWEWHMAYKNNIGNLESVVREPSAPLAICRAALVVGGVMKGAGVAV